MAGLAQQVDALAQAVVDAGARIDLPYVAASADIGSSRPMLGACGRPLAETRFRWLDADLRYWEDASFALRATFVLAARCCAEPFYFRHGRLGAWRPSSALARINQKGPIPGMGVGAAIVAPVYLPGGAIGAVTWASPNPEVEVEAVFETAAAELHALSLRFLATYAEWRGEQVLPVQLTRREIQVLKGMARGKTNGDIAAFLEVSEPTVRFHAKNAARKLDASGRTQLIRRAVTLGYIGAVQARAAG